MSYIPHTELDRKKMLEACGVQNLEDLFGIIPNEHRFPELNMPGPLSELEVLRELQELSESNAEATHNPCFLGAGASGIAEGGMLVQLKIQLLGIAVIFAWTVLVTWIILKIVSALSGLRVDPDSESEGLDVMSHGERGYNIE